MRHKMLTQRAPFCIGAMAKKGTLSQHFVTHVVPPLGTCGGMTSTRTCLCMHLSAGCMCVACCVLCTCELCMSCHVIMFFITAPCSRGTF